MNQRQKGVALVEFALILPFLLLLSIMAIEFGRAIWEYNILTKSVRDAARYLSIQTPGTPDHRGAQPDGLRQPGAAPGRPLAIGLSLSNVPAATCCTWQTAGTGPVINTVTVRDQQLHLQADVRQRVRARRSAP